MPSNTHQERNNEKQVQCHFFNNQVNLKKLLENIFFKPRKTFQQHLNLSDFSHNAKLKTTRLTKEAFKT